MNYCSERRQHPGYLEHIFQILPKTGERLLVGVIYDGIDEDGKLTGYKFQTIWNASFVVGPKIYASVADAKHDLFLLIEQKTGDRMPESMEPQ
jgi:hypothetical protein